MLNENVADDSSACPCPPASPGPDGVLRLDKLNTFAPPWKVTPAAGSVPANLQALRDADLDRLNALLKQSGTTAERQFLDRMAQSQVEARNISQSLLDNLNGIANDGQDNQIVAATTLTLTRCVCLPPRRSNSCSWRNLSNFG